jgi:hypothetical protein
MIVWRGRGIAVALIAFGSLILVELFTRSRFVEKDFYQNHGWPKLVGFWMAAALVYALRSWLGGGQEAVSIEPRTGKETRLSSKNSLFHISVRYWPLILFGLGIVFFFVRG